MVQWLSKRYGYESDLNKIVPMETSCEIYYLIAAGGDNDIIC